MTDETEELDVAVELEEVEVDAVSRVEIYDYSGAGTTNSGQLIFPYGAEVFCRQIGACALRIADKTGEIEALVDPNEPWVAVAKARGKFTVVK